MADTFPGGRRVLPPGWSITRDATESGEGSILVSLGRETEEKSVVAYFETTGRRVERLDRTLSEGPFDLFYLDGFGALRLVTLLPKRASWLYLGREARTVALVEGNEEAETLAWASGVGWVVGRPLLPNDPLGLGQSIESIRETRPGLKDRSR